MRLTVQALLVIGLTLWSCAPATITSRWADQIEATARHLKAGETVTLDLEPSSNCTCLIVVVPVSGLVIDAIPEAYKEVFREAKLTAAPQARLVLAAHDSLISSTLETRAVQQLHTEGHPQGVIKVTLVKAEGTAQIVGLE